MKSHFNTVWGIIFTTLFVLIMLPLPWFCNYEYVPSIAGIPNYIIGWAVIAIDFCLGQAVLEQTGILRIRR